MKIKEGNEIVSASLALLIFIFCAAMMNAYANIVVHEGTMTEIVIGIAIEIKTVKEIVIVIRVDQITEMIIVKGILR